MSNALETSKKMAAAACRALDSKKGEDIRVIDISEISVLADYFIIANGNSNSQVQALVDNVEEELAKEGYTVNSGKAMALGTGCCSISEILSSMYLIKKTVFSTIWNVSGKMERRSPWKIWKSKS